MSRVYIVPQRDGTFVVESPGRHDSEPLHSKKAAAGHCEQKARDLLHVAYSGDLSPEDIKRLEREAIGFRRPMFKESE